MNKSTLFRTLVQTLLSEEEIKPIIEIIGYHDRARTFTVYTLLQYWTQAAFEQWYGYRDGADRAANCGLPSGDYSTFSKKAKDVPYDLFKQAFQLLLKKCNRPLRRQLRLPKDLLLIDSTTITVGKTRLPWAPYHGERAGVKLHVALVAANEMPAKVVETIGKRHDGPVGEELADDRYILVEDRAYAKIERLDRFKQEGQSFVIRLKDNVQLVRPHSLRRHKPISSPVLRDLTCQLGTTQCRSEQRHRVVIFQDGHGHEIRVVTDLMSVSAEQIADMYKARWQIEVFFRWIKQHLNVPTLFGTTENAVFGQLYAALIVYILLKWIFDQTSPYISRPFAFTFIRFTRLLGLHNLPDEWKVHIQWILSKQLGT
jgi:hypothetical protein